MENLSVNTGDIIQFGRYDWRVLAAREGKALLLSDKILTKRPYHTESADITWAECDMRKYLNESFYNSAFTAEEKERIAKTRLFNNDNPWFGITGGINTIDKVFLLSLEEMAQYLGDSGQLGNRPGGEVGIDDEYNAERAAEDKDTGKTWWWLRSPGDHKFTVASIDADGLVYVFGSVTILEDGGVRPALWLNL